MKKNLRIGAIIEELTHEPCTVFSSGYFCKKFNIAKSSLSEDIRSANEILVASGHGQIQTIPGAGGGMKYIPSLSNERLSAVRNELITKLSDPSRILGGGFLYTSDIMYDSRLVQNMARYFAGIFEKAHADYVATVETKGIPLASAVAFMLDIPLVIIRREAKYSDGSTVSINYFSGSYDRIQKMSIAKRAVERGKSALVIDDFMRGGGSLKGLIDILSEFDISVSGIGVAIASREPIKKKIENYIPIIYLEKIEEELKEISFSHPSE